MDGHLREGGGEGRGGHIDQVGLAGRGEVRSVTRRNDRHGGVELDLPPVL